MMNKGNAKHLKNKQRINACSMPVSKMVGLVHARRCEKEIELFFIDEK